MRTTDATDQEPAAEPRVRASHNGRGLGDLIKDLRDETTTLVRQEVALARTEMTEKAAKAGRNIAYAVVGGAIAYLGLFFVLAAAAALIVWGLSETGMDRVHALWVAPLIVGVVVLAIGYGLVQKAISTFRRDSFAPRRTVDSLQENKRWVQHKVNA